MAQHILHNLLGTPPTLPSQLDEPQPQAFPTAGASVTPLYDNTSSVPAPGSGSAGHADPALGGKAADNLRGGAVGPDYSATTLQGAHFPTASESDDHPGPGTAHAAAGGPGGVAEPALGGKTAENLRGGAVGESYSATQLQGAHFPTTSASDSHPGGFPAGAGEHAHAHTSSTSAGGTYAGPPLGAEVDPANLKGGAVGGAYSATTLQGAQFPTTTAGDGHPGGDAVAAHPQSETRTQGATAIPPPRPASPKADPTPSDVRAQADAAAKRADADFAPTTRNEPSGTDEPAKKAAAAGPAMHDEKVSLKDKVKLGLNKVIHPQSSSGTDAPPPEPSYRELYEHGVTSKLNSDEVQRHGLDEAHVKKAADGLRRDKPPGQAA